MNKFHLRTALTAALIVFSLSTFGQFLPKGTLLGGGSFSFSANTNKTKTDFGTFKSKETTFSLQPNLLYFVTDNFGLGGMMNLTLSSYKPDGTDDKSTTSTFAIGPVARYYVADGPFFEAALGLGTFKTSSESGSDGSGSIVEAKFGFGYSIRVNEHVLFDPMIGYQTASSKYSESDYKYTNSGLFIQAGFSMILK